MKKSGNFRYTSKILNKKNFDSEFGRQNFGEILISHLSKSDCHKILSHNLSKDLFMSIEEFAKGLANLIFWTWRWRWKEIFIAISQSWDYLVRKCAPNFTGIILRVRKFCAMHTRKDCSEWARSVWSLRF